MTRRHGAIILGLAAAVSAAATAMAVWYYALVRLPDPGTSNRAGLMRWLVLREISAEPPEIQVALVDRFQEELKQGLATSEGATALSTAYRERLARNTEHLKQVWFRRRCAEYAEISPNARKPFLDDQIGAIAAWQAVLPAANDTTAGPAAGAANPAVQFFEELEGWIAAAQGKEREQMLSAVQDGCVYWLATSDLSEQTPEVRLALAVRIVRELNAGMRLDEILFDLTSAERTVLFANGELLLEVWLRDESRVFAGLPNDGRGKYLNRRLDEVRRWGVLEALSATPASGAGESSTANLAGLARLAALSDSWIERSEGQERANLVALVSALQRQILWRQLGR